MSFMLKLTVVVGIYWDIESLRVESYDMATHGDSESQGDL